MANDTLAAAKMEADEKEKDRAAAELSRMAENTQREKDRLLQQKQEVKSSLSQLRKDKRGLLCRMGERDEKRRKEGGSNYDDNGSDYFLEAMTDIDNEINEKQDELREIIATESSLIMMPQKSNISPMRGRNRSV